MCKGLAKIEMRRHCKERLAQPEKESKGLMSKEKCRSGGVCNVVPALKEGRCRKGHQDIENSIRRNSTTMMTLMCTLEPSLDNEDSIKTRRGETSGVE